MLALFTLRKGLLGRGLAFAALVAFTSPSLAADDDRAAYDKAITSAVNFLAAQQNEDGSFSDAAPIGVTGLCAAGILEHGRTADDPVVKKALTFLESNIKEDGGIYGEGSNHKNYETSLSVLAFAAANKDGRYDKLLASTDKFLKGIQWDASEEKEESDPFYGGAGYGGHKRPDLSNTAFMMEALKATGTGPDDEAMKKALVFVSRCQNLESEHNTSEFPAKNPDGGFYYTIAAGGSSQAGETPNGGLRSYASMTYAGLKSMIYAGLDKDDERVKAAVTWLGKHYTLDENPGMGQQGLFYYYVTCAKALDALGEEEFVTADGTKHPWRAELRAELLGRQQKNGSWVNETTRWMEGNPQLVTGYTLLAIKYAQPTAAK
ncbi:terpene cyclase/mutase family protein [Blastopirellula sp. J2-11]|uniref:prenyltransferase/squalene oxidase repeat-containing protein n=1 Tax=Blastopirellula sp. J2-11 TaxID=2943192 RepID=UPI0021CAC618|nr:prenyltransferase/squalene oxidase repeat-containing protein [Blastopirellula sp. J2-11]UUO06704.1 terpene cyclase/mutase family protein [Blastopirellula sp. J2-11]